MGVPGHFSHGSAQAYPGGLNVEAGAVMARLAKHLGKHYKRYRDEIATDLENP